MSKRAHCTIERDYERSTKVTIERHGERPSKQTKNSTSRRRVTPKTRVFTASSSFKPALEHQGAQLPSAAPAGGSGTSDWDSLNKILDELVTSDNDDDLENATFRDDEIDDVQPKETAFEDATLLETGDAGTRPGSRTKKHPKTPNEVLREWLDLWRDAYLSAWFKRDAPPKGFCAFCLESAVQIYRCTSCLNSLPSCSACLVNTHRAQPTHRIQSWDGAVWLEASLAGIGLITYLGHDGKPCPSSDDNSQLLVGDLDGFSSIAVRYCHCDLSTLKPKPLQLIEIGLFPCSHVHPRTAFTFRLLDVFNIFCTLGRTSAHKFYLVIERITRPGFPADVKDRYREMIWTHRRYLHLLNLRRAGYGFQRHDTLDVHPNDQALCCPACPRLGFNYEEDELSPGDRRVILNDTDRVYDGNFRCSRKAKKVDKGDICLSDGLAYFGQKERFKEWSSTVVQPARTEKPMCDHHKAGNDTSFRGAGRDITGIGAFTCTSHSCIMPRGMVDFTRGELFIYADWALGNVYRYLSAKGKIPIGMTYDVFCHWFVNYLSRLQRLPPELRPPEDLDIRGALPKWHALGHDPQCVIRWSIEYMQHVGQLEGEGPERVWAHFNEHSGSTSEQGPGHRTETLDNVAVQFTFEKIIRMETSLPVRFKDAKKMLIRERKNHEGSTASIPADTLQEWEQESIEPYKLANGRWHSVFADPVLKGGFQETLQDERKKESSTTRVPGQRPGAARWVSEGIELEHSIHQYNEDSKAHSKPTPRQANSLDSKRLALEERIQTFQNRCSFYMHGLDEPDRPRMQKIVEEDGEEKNVDLGLPSSFSPDTLASAGLSSLSDLEKRLRRGTCVDALQSVKRVLGARSATINFKNANVRGQIATTRSQSIIKGHNAKILKAQWRYENSRGALQALGMVQADQDQFLELRREDLKPLKLYYEEYAQKTGHGITSMSWIWRSEVAPNDKWQVEALKTEWFRSRERYKRWNEQLILLKREMIMAIRTFQTYQVLWEWRSKNGQPIPGMEVYARQRSRFFGELARRMFYACQDHLWDDVVSLRWCDEWLTRNTSGNQLCDPSAS
ncbi:hypothetical protein RhiJN_18365 [Ceratobasidium sp. AG-Ba]|nr:hypothetical protein RhiJN_18365 [Ceratobasidium sp. AG-Ba]